MIMPVIMAGGSGTRLWPLSRQLNPKQFLKLCGDKTLLQQTLARLNGLDVTAPLVICNDEHRFIVAEQVRQASVENASILLEPVGRNELSSNLVFRDLIKQHPDCLYPPRFRL